MKRGTPDHPKVLDLCDRLKCERYAAIGILEALWHFTSDYAPAGDIGRFSDTAIAQGVYWRKRPQALIEALIASRWLDKSETHRLVVHDWHEHADDACNCKLARAGRYFASGARPNLKRLSSADRAHVAQLYAHAVRTECAQEAHDERVPCALPSPPLPKPKPEPSRDDASTPPPPVRLPVKVAPIQAIVPDVFAFPEWFERIYARHPKKGDKQIAQQYIVQHIAEGKITSPDEYEQKHREWCESEEWRWRNGAKAPTLAKWTADDGYMYDPPETGKSALEMA